MTTTTRKHPAPPSNPHQHAEFATFLDRLSPSDRYAARVVMLSYVLGDVPPRVFASAMDLIRRSYKDR